MNEFTMYRELRVSLTHVIADEARRQELIAGRSDSSGFESFGKIKARLDKTTEAFKPLEKTLKEYWKVVSGEDVDLQASYLREMETETESALTELVRLAAAVNRAMWALSPTQERKIGQMSMDELERETAEQSSTEATDPGPEASLPAASASPESLSKTLRYCGNVFFIQSASLMD